jgi:hypothetical protein
VDPFLAFFENSTLATWIRGELIGSTLVFPVVVTLHTIGMGLVAGGSAAIDLRILGVAPRIPLKPMGRFLPLLWLGFVVNAVSGVLLLIAYPTKALTNPIFYFKVGMIALAAWLMHRTGTAILRAPEGEQETLTARTKVLAVASLACWIALITAGRLLAYTRRWEMLGIPAAG